ncbi:unnamed protein product, partial [Echinostoma caproni]|uniref:RING-type domain-containing protein n=1 Tax=Echinostoma caproni TaxID=27848 RepID=A0A183A2P4_9TREM
MGLCKCEKKKMTTLFCFEHRVNVCEFCMVANHPRCVVKPYLGWIKGGDFDPSCAICNERFDADESRECVRLVCLDVFHWDCLDKLISSAPPNTAPSGFLCPSCDHPIIPQRNHGGPVAEALRSFLNRTQWAANNFSEFHQTVLPIESSGVSSDKWATAQISPPLFNSVSSVPNPLPLPLLPTFYSPPSNSDVACQRSLSNSTVSDLPRNGLQILMPRQSLNLGT